MMRRKRVVLSIKDKYEIVRRLEEGESAANLAFEYGVGNTTICDIRKQKLDIIEYISKIDTLDGASERKTMKFAQNKVADEAVYKWYIENRSQGKTITGPILCEKAIELYKELGGSPSFQASFGWLKRFKSRHGIRDLQGEGENFLSNIKLERNEPECLITEDNVIVELVTENVDIKKGSIPSAAEAYTSLEIALSWFESQEESDPFQISVLKLVRDLAATKRDVKS